MPNPPPAHDGAIMVVVTVDPVTSTYVLALEIEDDRAYALDGDLAAKHVHAVHTAVARADYDAAVITQLRALPGLDEAAIGQCVASLRAARPAIEWPTAMTLVPGVSAFNGLPFLHIAYGGRTRGQWNTADALSHAQAVHQAFCAVELDTRYRELLISDIGLDRSRAGKVVGDLARHRAGA